MTGKLEKRRVNVTYKRTQQISQIKTAAECQLVDQVIVKINHLIFPKYDTSTTT